LGRELLEPDAPREYFGGGRGCRRGAHLRPVWACGVSQPSPRRFSALAHARPVRRRELLRRSGHRPNVLLPDTAGGGVTSSRAPSSRRPTHHCVRPRALRG
jgi:hypothetical protein